MLSEKSKSDLSRYNETQRLIMRRQGFLREVAQSLGIPSEKLLEWWDVWNTERPVRSFAAFVENELAGGHADRPEIEDLLKRPEAEWESELLKDTKHRIHRALGCTSTRDACVALRKRARVRNMGLLASTESRNQGPAAK